MPQVINGKALDTREGYDKITSTDKVTAGYHNGTALHQHGGAGAALSLILDSIRGRQLKKFDQKQKQLRHLY